MGAVRVVVRFAWFFGCASDACRSAWSRRRSPEHQKAAAGGERSIIGAIFGNVAGRWVHRDDRRRDGSIHGSEGGARVRARRSRGGRPTVARLAESIDESGYAVSGMHEEWYLSGPNVKVPRP
jgi:hypothetical protein